MQALILFPRPPLDVFVHHYSIIEHPEGLPFEGSAIVPPSLATGFFFIYNMRKPITIRIGDADQSLAYSSNHLITPTLVPVHHTAPGGGGMIRVIFHPGRLHQLLRVPLYELTGKLIDTEDLLGQQLREVQEQVVAAADNIKRIELIENFLGLLMRDVSPATTIIGAANQVISTHPHPNTVDQLIHELNINSRTLERRFHEYAGVAPKDYLSIFRFCRALKLMHAPRRINLTQVAHDNDYYDQSHFNREFRRFMGMSPGEYRKLMAVPLTSDQDVTYNGLVMGGGSSV